MNVTEEKIVIRRGGKVFELYPVFLPDGRGGQVGPLLSYKDVAVYAGVSSGTVRNRLNQAKIPIWHSPGGKMKYVLKEDVDRVFAVHPMVEHDPDEDTGEDASTEDE